MSFQLADRENDCADTRAYVSPPMQAPAERAKGDERRNKTTHSDQFPTSTSNEFGTNVKRNMA
jgi:hypothetical protein